MPGPDPGAWLPATRPRYFHPGHLADATLVPVIKQPRREPQLNPLTSASGSTPPLKLPGSVFFMTTDYVTHDTLLLHTAFPR